MTMLKVRTRKDYKLYYWMLQNSDQLQNGAELCRDIKKALREYHHRKPELEGSVFCDYGDSAMFHRILPEDIQTRKDAVKFYEYFIRSDYTPSPYDCTGSAQTTLYAVHQRSDGRWGLYYGVTLDV